MADPRFDTANRLLNEDLPTLDTKTRISQRFAAAVALLERAHANGKGVRFNAGDPSKAYTLVRDINKYRKLLRGPDGTEMSDYDAFIVRRVKMKNSQGTMVFTPIIEIVPRVVPTDDEIIDL